MAKILIIDDDKTMQSTCAAVLTNAKHLVTTADNGFEGIESVRSDPPHLILMDMVMRYGGLSTLRVLREQFPGIRVIMMSGTEKTRLEIARGIGASRVIAKPFSAEQLLTLVNEALAEMGEN